MALANLIGKQFGRWTVLAESEIRTNHKRHWLCRCQCGNQKLVVGSNLLSGQSVSCGCFKCETVASRSKFNGASQSHWFEFDAWRAMFRRCYDPKANNYHRYGGRGIAVCMEWHGSKGFAKFLSDMGKRPSPKHSLDRLDNDGNYEPSNCQWRTRREQSRNKSNNRRLTYLGITRCLTDWAHLYGLEVKTLECRLKSGRTIHDALTTAVKTHGKSG